MPDHETPPKDAASAERFQRITGIAVIFVLIAFLVILAATHTASDGKKNTPAVTTPTSLTAAPTTTAQTVVTTAATTVSSQTVTTTVPPTQTMPATTTAKLIDTGGKLSAAYSVANTWAENDLTCQQFDFTVKSKGSVSDTWEVTIAVPAGYEIKSFWNCKLKKSGTSVTVTPESYNAQIPAGGTASFGIQIAADEVFTPVVTVK
ncbi:MAG: cellulose binding domain-containing protein [Oscillospiraceae bacterium]